MDIVSILFYVFATILVISASLVVTVRNPVYAALALVLAFANAAVLWMLQRAEFLAISLILVYVGAVMVLFLFVVMMLDVNIERIRKGMMLYLPPALLVAGVVVAELSAVFWFGFPQTNANGVKLDVSSLKELSKLIYGPYAFAFELAGMLLLLALIAAVALTLRRRKLVQAQNPAAQANVKASDRLRLVKVDAVKANALVDAPSTASSDSNSQGV